MKIFNKYTLYLVIIFSFFSCKNKEIILTSFNYREITEWDILYESIKICESNNNPLSKNKKSSATGDIQALNIYVYDVNRILGENKYTLNCRFDPNKTREMFEIIQNHYNPEHNIKKAIVIHRYGPGNIENKFLKCSSYYLNIINKMEEIKLIYEKEGYKIIK